jgi:SEC-C motif
MRPPTRYPRNRPCFCGSGKKYKHCHYGKPFHPEREVTVHQRNIILLTAAIEIFGFSKGRSWADLKKNISGDQIRRFYEVQRNLWTPDTDWAAIMPVPDGKLRGLYLGDIRPELTLRNLIRFSLYSDHLFVIDPFHNPWIMRPKYNPIENPNQFKADTINLLNFLFLVSPWIESGILYIIPDPGQINVELKWATARLAQARIGDREPDERDLEEAFSVGKEQLRRVLYALPEEKFFRALEKSGQILTDEQKRDLLRYARAELRKDPIAWERSVADNFEQGQMLTTRGGANLETALLICNTTGAFPYTNMHTRWREIIEARDEMSEAARIWSPFTRAFQELEFRFLNNVDPKFAQQIREDGRFESFRTLMRRIGKDATEITDFGSLDSYVRDCKDALIGEHGKAQAEWGKINESFFKLAGGGAAASCFISGHFLPDVASLSAATVSTLAQLGLRYFKQQNFRKANPMSVFIDLSRKEPPGGVRLY